MASRGSSSGVQPLPDGPRQELTIPIGGVQDLRLDRAPLVVSEEEMTDWTDPLGLPPLRLGGLTRVWSRSRPGCSM